MHAGRPCISKSSGNIFGRIAASTHLVSPSRLPAPLKPGCEVGRLDEALVEGDARLLSREPLQALLLDGALQTDVVMPLNSC